MVLRKTKEIFIDVIHFYNASFALLSITVDIPLEDNSEGVITPSEAGA